MKKQRQATPKPTPTLRPTLRPTQRPKHKPRPTQRPKWDFDEHSDYVSKSYMYDGNKERFVFVKEKDSQNEMNKHAAILMFLDKFTLDLQKYCELHNKCNNKCIELFIHTKHTFFELYYNDDYRGVNKPKEIHHCSGAKTDIGPDKKLRAHYRYVMIIIPENAQELHDLYCHEIAHTLCNHVQYRHDDHHGNTEVDFPYNERLVIHLAEKFQLLQKLQRLYE